jgi:apolipoprotein N-acyltransferase
MLAVFLYGGIRLAYAPAGEETVRVHGITAVDMRLEHPRLLDALRGDWDAYRQFSGEIQEIYLQATLREAQAGAQIVHWPEMAISMDKADEPAFLERAAAIAADEAVYLVLAYTTNPQEGGRGENKLVVLDPSGEVVLTHFKYALANMEGTTGADGILRTVETPFGTLSGLICNDTNHEEVVTQAGRNGTDLLFSPSLELRQIDPLMAHIGIYRAIENGVTLIRQADNGLSFVADPYGRMITAMDHFNTNDRVMVAQVPVSSAFTIYPYIRDAFAWLAILGLIGLVVWGRRRASQVR